MSEAFTRDSVTARVVKIIADVIDISVAEISIDDRLADDLYADSGDAALVLMDAEIAFDIDISDEDAAKIVTVRDLVDFVANRLGVVA